MNWGTYVKISGQAQDTPTGPSKSVPAESHIGLERLMQPINRDGFGDVTWSRRTSSLVQVFVTDLVLIAEVLSGKDNVE